MHEENKEPKFIVWVLLGLILLVVSFGAYATYDIYREQDEMAELKYDTYYEMNSALCSRTCLDNPVNITRQLAEAYTTGNVNPLYEPYLKSMGCYDLDKVEHKECCLQYKLRK